MENLIVTVTNLSKSFLLDLEVPADVPAQQLLADIEEALCGYDPHLLNGSQATSLFCNRLGRPLRPEETLEDAGVWDGDYITMIGVR